MRFILKLGKNIGQYVKNRITKHLNRVAFETDRQQILVVDRVKAVFDFNQSDSLQKRTVLLVFLGNVSDSQDIIPSHFHDQLTWESYHILFQRHTNEIYSLYADGLPLHPEIRKNISFNALSVNYGAIAGSYAVLELLGFAFLHPLEPYTPPVLRFHRNVAYNENQSISFIEKPYWPERAFHLHTQHPLELTEVLQGHDIPQFGKHGKECKDFSELSAAYRRDQNLSYLTKDERIHLHNTTNYYCERWEDMIIDVDSFYEWSVANCLNMVEWLLLGNFKWGDELGTRSYRLKRLTHLGHQYSLLIGADVPIGNIQQHGWYIVNVRLPITQQKKQIIDRIDWVFKAGFDFLTTESGLSEFTHPECDLMVDLFNTFASHIHDVWQRHAAVKVHCSTGQFCSEYLDPRSGDPINFNFLPTFAHTGLGILPHTVQMYSFDDPTAGSYGNDNFRYIEDYLVYEAKLNKRSVVYYGETAYWVNVDIDVPLFLPIYGERRLKDLRKIAIREQLEGFHISGQMNFDSGWEYGYWLNDVITARASWNPHVNSVMVEEYSQCTQDSETKEKNCPPYNDEWKEYASTLQIFTKIFGSDYSSRLTELLVRYTQLQARLLIDSHIHGRPNPNLKKVSGIAYLSGLDTWVEVPRFLGLSFTQPDKVHFHESDDPDWPYVIELLEEIEEEFEEISDEFQLLLLQVQDTSVKQPSSQNTATASFQLNQQAVHYLEEITDAVQLTYLRAKQVRLLYESNDADLSYESKRRQSLLQQSREVLKEAQQIVTTREQYYRVAWQRIASWRENPTVYRFGYLWAVHSLYYWWRDQGIAEALNQKSSHSVCYLNRMDPTEVAVGWGKYTVEWIRYIITNYTPFASIFPLEIVNCLIPPAQEFQFPRDL